jgi:hypothetical protein
MKNPLNSKHLYTLSLMLLFISTKAFAIQSPQYTAIYKDEKVEYRHYEPCLLTETFVENSYNYRSASNEGFMRLFGYITGNNNNLLNIEMAAPIQHSATNEKIAVTAPVPRVEIPEGWHVAFMLLGTGVGQLLLED